MTSYQPTLWDNIEVQNGYRSLYALQLEQAEEHFQKALQIQFVDKEEIGQVIETIQYWKPVLQSSEQEARELTDLFNAFECPRFLMKFKSLLLEKLTPQIEIAGLCENWIQIFDLLLDNKEYETAIKMLLRVDHSEAGDYCLYYFFGQAYFRLGDTVRSNDYYGRALLYYPDESYLARIESERIQNIIASRNPYMAYLYGLLMKQFGMVLLPENFFPLNEQHERAIAIFQLYRDAERANMNHDFKKEIAIRKEIKKMDPDFFESFLDTR